MIVYFDSNKKFVLCGNIITKQKISKQNKLPTLALQPYLPGLIYDRDKAEAFIKCVQLRQYKFDMLITLKQFMTEIKLLKGA